MLRTLAPQIPITYRRRSRFTFVTAFVTTDTQLVMAGPDPAISRQAAFSRTEASAIFTPGPMVEDSETFFM